VMTIAWSGPARRLARDLPDRGIAGLWALLHPAKLAVLQMALLPGLNDGLGRGDLHLEDGMVETSSRGRGKLG